MLRKRDDWKEESLWVIWDTVEAGRNSKTEKTSLQVEKNWFCGKKSSEWYGRQTGIVFLQQRGIVQRENYDVKENYRQEQETGASM